MATGIYVGVGGKARNVKSLYVGVDGKARRVTKGYIGVGGKARLFYAAEEIGKQWIFTSNGTFTVPVTGRYTIELHGKGGAGGDRNSGTDGGRVRYNSGGGGGGSGQRYENVELTSGTKNDIKINSSAYFGNLYSIGPGGSGGDAGTGAGDGGRGGSATGNIASSGGDGGSSSESTSSNGGYGGSGGASVGGYGDGGKGYDTMNRDEDDYEKPGAIIITLTNY